MKDPLYTQSNHRVLSSHTYNSSNKSTIPYFHQVPILSDSESNSPVIKHRLNTSYSKNSFLSTPTKTESTASPSLPTYSKMTIDTFKEHELIINPETTPRGINNFNEEEMDEFCNDTGITLTQRHLSDKAASISVLKKSMSDIISKNGTNTSMSFTSLQKTRSIEKDLRGNQKEFSIVLTRSIGDSPRKSNFFREEDQGTLFKINSSPISKNHRTIIQNNVSLLDFTKNIEEIERENRSIKNVLILEKILEFLGFEETWKMSKLCCNFRNQRMYKQLFSKRFSDHFSNGLTYKEQVWYWNGVIDFRRLRNYHPFAYSQHFAKNCSYLQEIRKDLDRTLPEYNRFSTEEGKAALLRVLMAISNTIKDMGYIQGLNSIAGVFLFYLKEEEAFWILMYFMEKLKFKELLKEDFNKIHLLNYQLHIYLEHYIPDLAKYFNEKDLEISYFTTSWFLTLFSYILSVPNVVKVWNFLLTNGLAFLVQFTLAIFSKYEDRVLKMEIEEVGNFLKNEMRNLSDDERLLFKSALNIKVSKRILKEIEFHYENGKPKLRLVMDCSGKTQLITIYEPKRLVFERSKQTLNNLINPLPVHISSTFYSNISRNSPRKSSHARTSSALNFTLRSNDKIDCNVSIEDDIKKNSSQILQTIEDNKNKSAFAPSDTQNLFEDYKSRPNLISILKPESQHEKVLIQRESLSPVHQPNKSFGRENHESRKDLFSPEILGGDSKIDRFHRRTITESPVFSHKFTNGNDTRTKPPVKRIGVNEYSSKYKKTTQFPQKEVLNINSTFHQRKASPVYEMRKTQYVNESNNKSSFS